MRLRGLPSVELFGARFPLAVTPLSRLLGLALLDRDQAGPGMVIPRCRSVHTLGMRFALDVLFLDRERRPLSRHDRVGATRLLIDRRAAAVLERPAG